MLAIDAAPAIPPRAPASLPPLAPIALVAGAGKGTRVARLVHMSDLHVVDDESPARVALLDDVGEFAGAARPQEAWSCRLANAAVRTVNALHEKDPIDLVLVTGDAIDDAQTNELEWLLAILDGAPSVACDSGVANDPVAGPANDPKDPFVAAGLRPRWQWVTGNHDVLVQGTFPVSPVEDARTRGAKAAQGTRDWSQPSGPLVRGVVPPDDRRALLTRDALVAKLGAHAAGAKDGRVLAAVDVGPRVRVIVLDTAAETGGAPGLLRRATLDDFLKPELARAKADHRWVILTMHHALDAIGDGGAAGGVKQADAVPASELEALVRASPHVIATVVGHGHIHRVRAIGHAWEIETGSILDEPGELRVVEVWDEGKGRGSLRSRIIAESTEGDPVAAEGRRLAKTDRDRPGSRGGEHDRDVVLPFSAPW